MAEDNRNRPILGEDFAEEGTPIKKTDLSATVDAFKGRINRKIAEQAQAASEAEVEARARQAALLEALMNIRKSLIDVAHIDVGDRFSFSLDADDQNGWPRITVRLIDDKNPHGDYPFFQVTAHDRNQRGTLEICSGDTRQLTRICLADEGAAARLPAILKKCVRTYLDLVGEIVLEAESGKEDEDAELKSTKAVVEETAPSPANTLSGDLFEDDIQTDMFETLPAMAKVDTLKGLDSE